MPLWPKNFFEAIRCFWLGVFALILLFYIEAVARYLFDYEGEVLHFILNLFKAVSGFYLLVILFVMVYRIRIVAEDNPATSFPGGLTVHIGLWLLLFVMFSLGGLFLVFNAEMLGTYFDNTIANHERINEALIMFFSAGVGSSITSMLAYLLHASEKKDFDVAFVPWYFARPLMGMLLGLIFYFALKGGILVLTMQSGEEDLSDLALAAVGSLVGMFSKNALEKLREVFNTLFSTKDATAEEEGQAIPEAPADIVAEYYQKNRQTLMEKYKALAVGLGKKEVGKIKHNTDCIVFTVASKDQFLKEHKVPLSLSYTASTGVTYKIFTDVREEEKITGSTTGKPQPGDSIKVGESEGTIGLLVRKNVGGKHHQYLLSCYHVLCADHLEKGVYTFAATGKNLDVSYSGNVIGHVMEGKMNHKIDGALALTLKDFNKVVDHAYITAPKTGILPIGKTHIDNPTTLYLAGGKTHSRRGVVNSYDVDAEIQFGNQTCKLEDLIVTEKMSDKGDSGAPVFAEDGRLVGLLVGDSKTKSYIQPILALINQLKFEIDYQV